MPVADLLRKHGISPPTPCKWRSNYGGVRGVMAFTLAGDVARAFFEDVVAQARGRRLLSDEHFTVDGTLLEAWAGQEVSAERARHPSRRAMPAIRP